MITIDFGTTNSSVALFTEGDIQPRIQKLAYLDPDSIDPNVVPSAVSTCKNAECQAIPVVIGHDAIRHYFGTNHDISFLQEMKLHFDNTTKQAPTLVETGEKVILREEGGFLTPERRVLTQLIYEGDVPLQPSEFVPGTAHLIKTLIGKVDGEKQHRKDAVFGVPASFQLGGKKRLREAAKRAILGEFGDKHDGIHIYLEPLAAARAYRDLDSGNTLVLDYGGGTLDISVMALGKGGHFDPAKVSYDGFSEGGSRMDQRLLEYCVDKSGKELAEWFKNQNILMRRRVKRSVEAAKIKLSTGTVANVEFPGSPEANVEIDRADLTMALSPIMTRMVAKVSEVVIKSVDRFDNINFVVLSGGSSLSSVVQETILSIFRHIPQDRFFLPDPRKPEDVETCLCAVAKGLAWLRRDGFPAIDFGD
jgi:molecular chaperone DnaK (HSP70)